MAEVCTGWCLAAWAQGTPRVSSQTRGSYRLSWATGLTGSDAWMESLLAKEVAAFTCVGLSLLLVSWPRGPESLEWQ